jgi:hypothetical protein
MRIRLAVAALFLATQAAPALADRDKESGAPLPPRPAEISSPIRDHFYVIAAFYSPAVSTNVRIDPTNAGPGVIGTPVNGERDLGLPARLDQGRVEFMFRMRERNKLRVDYFEADRSASKVLANDIVFGNVTFDGGNQLQSSVNWRLFGLTYTYSLYQSDRLEIGTGLAAYFLQVEAMGTAPAQAQYQDVSAAEPFPTLPLDFTWCISRRFDFTARANYLRASLNGFSGWLADLHSDLQYRWNPYFSIGLGYTSIRDSLTRHSGSFPGVVSMDFEGPEAFVRFSY